MSAPSYLQEPQLISLQALFKDLKVGALQVPRFQREFVWDPERRLNLLDSIEKGIPLGSILTWRTSLSMATFPRVGGVELQKSPGGSSQYLLDGHQRVSTLFSAFQPESKNTLIALEDWELEPGDIVYDLEGERFVLKKDYARSRATHSVEGLPLHLLFEGPSYMRFLRDNYSGNEILVQRADVLAEKFRNYKFPLVPIVTDDLNMVLEAFQRVNSSGVIMSDAHIVHALSFSINFDLMQHLDRASRTLADIGWGDLDHKYILAVVRALTSQNVTEPEPRTEADKLKQKPELIDDAVAIIRKVADWLWNECRIASPAFLPYSYQLPLLASIFDNLTADEIKRDVAFYRNWFWKASLTGIFRSMRENDYVKARDNLGAKSLQFEAFDRRKNVGFTTGSFYFQRARVKIVMLRMLQQRLAKKKPSEIENARLYLQQNGAASMKNVLKKQRLSRSDAGTKFIAIRPEDTGVSIGLGMPKRLASELFINDLALHLLNENDEGGFFNERARLIRDSEIQFISSLGLDSKDEDRQN